MPPQKNHRFRPLVLIVDECKPSRIMMRFYLDLEGYEVVEAACGQDAFERASANPPDIVLIDLNMPGLSGVLATQRLRSIAEMSRVPIIACAGPDSQAYRDAVRAAECDAYITKPINPTVLLSVIKSLLNRRSLGVLPSSHVTQLAQTM